MVAKKETKEAERKKKNETKEAIDTKKKDINSKKEDIIQETIVKTIQEVHVTKVESPQTESENDLKENTAEILESESIMNSSQETKADVDRFPEKNNQCEKNPIRPKTELKKSWIFKSELLKIILCRNNPFSFTGDTSSFSEKSSSRVLHFHW